MKIHLIAKKGGDIYNKQNQIDSIIKNEPLTKILEYSDISELDNYLSSFREDEKIIILHEENSLSKFEKIVKSEYPHLSEQIEVIPELFFRTKLKESVPANVQQILNDTSVTPPIKKTIIPIKPIFDKEATNFLEPQNPGGYTLIVDPPNGYWFPGLKDLLKYCKGYNDLFRTSGQNDQSAGSMSIQNIRTAVDSNNNSLAPLANILSQSSQIGLKSYNLAKEINKDVAGKLIKLDQDKIDKLTKNNPQLPAIIAAIASNLEASDKWVTTSIVKEKTVNDQYQTAASKISQMLGVDHDIQTGAENLRKGGLALIVDIGEALAKEAREKKEKERKEKSSGSDTSAWLSHDKAEELIKSIFNGFVAGQQYFVDPVSN
jgi:hypothetical protein